jgi:2-hydroxycyclohexanecarboxyl-CoA dehydrogenase
VDLRLQDKVVLITGSGSNGGIGQHMARCFAAEGARVAVNDISTAGVQRTCAEITEHGGVAIPACFDITKLDEVEAGIAAVEASEGRLDVLVNNAALLVKQAAFVETSAADCRREMDVVLYGSLNCMRASLPGMIKRQYGKIINVLTDAARSGEPRQANYSAAKGGVLSFTRSIAKEVGQYNINVNGVSPGATNSPMRAEKLRGIVANVGAEKAAEMENKVRKLYALRRIGEPGDVANAVLFLSSDQARHITGQILSVNGGYAMY